MQDTHTPAQGAAPAHQSKTHHPTTPTTTPPDVDIPILSAKQATAEAIASARSERDVMVIGTHSATHHCDEVISCVLLTQLYPNSIIVRQRDEAILKLCDIVVDVGGKYDPDTRAFDHHQSTFSDPWSSDHTVRLSSAGLVWRHYGIDLLKNIVPGLADENYKTLHNVLYDLIFEAIDAGDNGVKPCHCKPTDVSYIGGFPGLSGLVGSCNTSWLVWQHESDCFRKALQIVHQHFLPILYDVAKNWFNAVDEIRTAPRINLPKNTQYKIIELKEFYMFARFFRYVLNEQEEDVLGCIWKPAGSDHEVWATLFRPWKWLDRSTKALGRHIETLKTKEEALNRLDQQCDEYFTPLKAEGEEHKMD